jgi:hypothetical protein
MLRSTTITGVNRIASSSGLCVCRMMDKIVKFIGDSGDKSEWVEYRNGKLRIRTEEQLVCLECQSPVCSCCRSGA